MEETLEKFKLGSKALGKELESKYHKFALGIPVNIEVPLEQEVEKRMQEFEDNKTNVKKVVAKYDLDIIINNEKKLWSVSNKVLTTITEHINETQKFKIILRDLTYEVIPLGLKD